MVIAAGQKSNISLAFQHTNGNCLFSSAHGTREREITEGKVRAKFGDDKIKIYKSTFTLLYHALTQKKQLTKMKLVCARAGRPKKKVVGLHMIGR